VAKGDATSDQLGHWLSCGFPGVPQKSSDEYGAAVVQNEVGGDSFAMLIDSNDVEGLKELGIASGIHRAEIMTAWNKLSLICNVGQRPKQPEPDPEPELEFEDEVESSVVVGGAAAIEIQMKEQLLIRSDTNLTGLKGVYLTEKAAQAYLQHWEKKNPAAPQKERAAPLQVQEHLLIRSDRSSTGFKGVRLDKHRYQAKCTTPPCRQSHLGSFGTPEEAAQAYLQHWEKEHPEELQQERAAPLPVQQHLLIRSERNSTGFKGVYLYKGRYQAKCDTASCHSHNLGRFGTPEEAAQAYLQHWEKEHPEELEKERAPPLQVQEHLLMRSDKGLTGFKGVFQNKGRYQAKCTTAPCRNHYLGTFDTPEEAAQAHLQHHQEKHGHGAGLIHSSPPGDKEGGHAVSSTIIGK
jgi:hypothetical protein